MHDEDGQWEPVPWKDVWGFYLFGILVILSWIYIIAKAICKFLL